MRVLNNFLERKSRWKGEKITSSIGERREKKKEEKSISRYSIHINESRGKYL